MTLVAAAAAALALAGALRVAMARARAPRLPAPAAAGGVEVAVLLPVRDEADNVEACLAAVRAQTVPVRIRVLDDGSTDRTRELAESVARADPRVAVVVVPPPPAACNPKVHALATGARGLAPEWILLLDADARPAPEALARTLAAAFEHDLDAVSLAARQRARTAGEALITPPVFALLDALLGDWRQAALGRGRPVANGQFFLVRGSALAQAGGFDALLGDALDDVALAHRLAAAGGRVGFWRAGPSLEVRMYHGLAATFRGWRRNLNLMLGERPLILIGAAAFALLPAAVAAAVAAAGRPGAALLAWAGGAGASILLRGGGGSSPLWGCLYPADAVAFAACALAAAADRARGRVAAWRGRPVAGSAAPPRRP